MLAWPLLQRPPNVAQEEQLLLLPSIVRIGSRRAG